MKTPKKSFRGPLLALGLFGILSLANTWLGSHVYAATPSSDLNRLLVTVSDKKTDYQVTAANSDKTYTLTYSAGDKGYLSPPLVGATGNPCVGPGSSGLAGLSNFNISVKVNGKVAGSDSFSFCGKGFPFIQTKAVSVSTPQNPASFSGCISYEDDQGKTQTFKPDATGSLSGPNGKTYALKFNNSGCVNKISNLPPGSYTVKADFLPPNMPNQHYEHAVTLQAGQDFKLTGALAGDPNSGGGAAPSADAKDACKDFADGGSKENNTFYNDCLQGFADGDSGKSKAEACENGYNPGPSQDACLVGFNAASGSRGDDTSACVANSSTTLEWLMCPLIVAISDGADGLNKFVESQLDFSTDNFLPDSGSNIGAYRAWSVIKDLATSVLIIILLIMVFSQAAGSGVFEAYTVRKILPRLVIAVIAMQLSWQLCIFIIHLVNDLGNGLAQLMTAPFGGKGNMDLGSLLNHLSGFWAGATSVGLTAALVAGGFLGAVFLPGALMIAFSILITVLVGLASVLFRNIIIIACVIFAPIALLLWVIPSNAMKKYWNLWSDNFTKALLLFPIMVALIYGGRIFAYIAGGLGNPGFLDLIMILVGFFAPYAILPKAFKWGGSWMSAGANAIATNGAVKKARELNRKEMGDWQKRRQNLYGKANLDPGSPDYAKYAGRKWGVIPTWQGKLGKTMMTNIRGGRYMPTKRALGTAIQRQDEENSKEKGIMQVIAERERQKAYGKTGDVMAGKNVSINMLTDALAEAKGATGKKQADANRKAEAALRDLIKSNSFYELDKIRIKDPKDGREKFIWETDLWFRTIVNDNELYGTVSGKRPDWQPHRLPSGGPGYRGQWGAKEQGEFRDRLAKQGKSESEIATEMDAEGRRRERLRESTGLPEHENLQYAKALTDVIDETNPQQLANQSPLVFDRINRMAQSGVARAKEAKKVLGNAEVARSAGNTAEADRLTREAQELQVQANMLLAPADSLRESFNRTAKSGGAQLLASIAGGAETGELVDKLLATSAQARNDVNIQLPHSDSDLLHVKAEAPEGGLETNLNAIIENAQAAKVSGAAATTEEQGVPQVASGGGGTAPSSPGAPAATQPAAQPQATPGGPAVYQPGAVVPGTPIAGLPGGAGIDRAGFKQAMKEALEETGVAGSGGTQFQAREVPPTPSASTQPQETYVKLDNGGTLIVPHQRGENVSEGGVILPRGTDNPNNTPPAAS
jgi:hypothetical protein